MSPELLEIQPRELTFTFELEKQSSCSVELVNKCDRYVAFKVKTTSPKKYCVRPNTGIVKPRETCDFTVTMKAQQSAPPDMPCKDKFLIQSTIVPFGTTAEDITTEMFAKDKCAYIEENKLRVVLVSPPHSPVLLPINGVIRQEPVFEDQIIKGQELTGVENVSPPHKIAKFVEELKIAKELKPEKKVENLESAKDVQMLTLTNDTELKLARNVENLKAYLNELELKLHKAEVTITKLTKERSTTIQEREALQRQLAVIRGNSGGQRDRAGFPLLFVCMVALIGLALGYLIRS